MHFSTYSLSLFCSSSTTNMLVLQNHFHHRKSNIKRNFKELIRFPWKNNRLTKINNWNASCNLIFYCRVTWVTMFYINLFIITNKIVNTTARRLKQWSVKLILELNRTVISGACMKLKLIKSNACLKIISMMCVYWLVIV